MPYYRVDKRLFAVGAVVTPAGEYYGKFTGIAKQVEDHLEARRPPGGRARTECTFVFSKLQDAEAHWRKMRDGKLYEVAIEDGEIVHTGDMHLMDLMNEAAEQGAPLSTMAEQYWSSRMTPAPVVEVLVPSARIIAVINTDEGARRAAFISHYKIRGAGPPDVETDVRF